jgi:hypothetical protein
VLGINITNCYYQLTINLIVTKNTKCALRVANPWVGFPEGGQPLGWLPSDYHPFSVRLITAQPVANPILQIYNR